MTQFTDCLAPRPFLRALRQLLSREQLQHALAFSPRSFRNRRLPAPLVLLLLIAGFIQGPLGLPRILAWLGFAHPVSDISDQALYQARQRIGWRPLWWLRRHVLDWLAHTRTDPNAFYRGRRLIAVDGTTLTVADTPKNERLFGKSRNQHKKSGFPLMRVLALCEVGTRALVHWIARPYRTSEQKLLPRLLPHVPAGSLLIADRNFHNWNLWDAAKKAGFSMLLRVQAGPRFPVLERFEDGSYLSEILPRRGKKKKQRAIRVRVIECRITIGTHTSTYRLLTNLLDPKEAPALELVDVYSRRWEIESAFAEFKSQLAKRTTGLRSGHPLSVMAELDALLIGYFVVRRIALRAARQEKVDPLSISFSQVLQTVVCYVLHPTMSSQELYRVAAKHRNRRRKRQCRRCRKVVRCAWPVKKPTDHAVSYQKATIDILEPPP